MLTNTNPMVIDHSVSSVDQADGDVTLANLLSAFGIAEVGELVILGREGRKLNKIEAEPCSDTLAADSGTKAYALWAGFFTWSGNTPIGANLVKLGTGNVTIGTATGASGGTPGSDHRFGDTLTWTESNYYADLRAGLGTEAAAVHSPADNTIAKLIVGELGLADFVAIESITGLKWRVRAGA